MSGIYKITNIINGKCYIGQSKDTSITEAAYVSGIEKSNICANCNGRKRSAGGYKWEYAL